MSAKQQTGPESQNPHAYAMYLATRARRRQRHRDKDSGSTEISDLNITPMLDLMTIILVFLLMNFASSSSNVNVANLTLPYSSAKLPIEEALTMTITKEGVLVDQRLVTRFDNGRIAEADLVDGAGTYLVRPVYDALSAKAEHFKRIEDGGGTQFVGRIAVIADKSTPYSVIFPLLFTAGRAEFGQFKMFVQKP
jgi:biopolymer transport protein ExbD